MKRSARSARVETMDVKADERAAKENLPARYEPSDLDPQVVARLGMIFLIMMAIVLVGASALVTVVSGQLPDLLPAPPLPSSLFDVTLPTPPRVQPAPLEDVQRLHASEDAILGSYGWADQNAQIARIPIERAMDLLAQRGLPARPASAAQQFRDHGTQMPGDASSGRMMEAVQP
jgi:hypothetical protein